MGKSLKNVTTPDEMYAAYGADTLRLFEMFTGPLVQDRPWDTKAVVGPFRQLQRIWRVVIDENTGVIVIGDQVRISTVAIAQGNLTIRITETPQVSQPAPFSETGTTTVVPRTDIQVDQGQNNKLAVVSQGVSLQELVNGLNALGIGPRDMISILQAIKAAGALQADIEVL